MARHCHEASNMAGDPFTNILFFLFFLSLSLSPDNLKAVSPFLDRIPRELHEQYMTDLLTEFMKMPETSQTADNSAISFKYGLIVAFARKS
jgi:signal transduction protein with GAF and PtsI domain